MGTPNAGREAGCLEGLQAISILSRGVGFVADLPKGADWHYTGT